MSHAEDHEHPEFLAHHFHSPAQQFEAAKLGMWLFLATEVLLFGGLFCAYAVFRANHPEMFDYGSRFLDTRWGAINTVVLIMSSVTMALAVSCAQCNLKRELVFYLLLTLLFAGNFLVIKYLEYSHKFHEHLVWGVGFYENPGEWEPAAPEEAMVVAPVAGAEEAAPADPLVTGRALWSATCRSCHGVGGEGLPGQGKDIRGSEFITGKTDAELVEFVKAGRMPFDPLNTTGIQMPPKGGNPLLTDDDLRVIIAYLRTLEGLGEGGVAPAAAPDAAPDDEGFWIPRSSIPPARDAPPGLAAAALGGAADEPAHADAEAHHVPHFYDVERPANAHLFFGIYFMMTGLHGLHVLAGMVIIGWLLVRSVRGEFGSAYFTPVDLGGLYWHIVDLIWIFLFPLLYLIG